MPQTTFFKFMMKEQREQHKSLLNLVRDNNKQLLLLWAGFLSVGTVCLIAGILILLVNANYNVSLTVGTLTSLLLAVILSVQGLHQCQDALRQATVSFTAIPGDFILAWKFPVQWTPEMVGPEAIAQAQTEYAEKVDKSFAELHKVYDAQNHAIRMAHRWMIVVPCVSGFLGILTVVSLMVNKGHQLW